MIKDLDLRIGFTCGAMDLLHAGHVLMLEECKTHCDFLIVGLHTNPKTDRPEKNSPVQSLIERYIQLKGCEYVDEIMPYETESDLLELLSAMPIDVRFVGSDWEGKEYTGHDLDIEVIFNKRNHGYSSSDLRKRVATRQLSDKGR